MPELVLLSVDRQVFRDTYRAAASGDEAALRDIEELWRDYDRVEIECFLCGAACRPGPGAMALPERDDDSKLLIVPLCDECAALPRRYKMGKAIKILKRMYRDRPSGPVVFRLQPTAGDRVLLPLTPEALRHRTNVVNLAGCGVLTQSLNACC